MGKIIFQNVHPDLLKNIQDFCKERSIPFTTFEELSAGLNHAEVGALIAKKWNFPDNLISAIRYHHDPKMAPKEYQNIVETVYLANVFCSYIAKTVNYDEIDQVILAKYSITNERQLQTMLEQFNQVLAHEVQY